MIAKEATYKELESAVRTAFADDKEIFKFYDKNAVVTNLDDLVQDVMRKLKEHVPIFPDTTFKTIWDKGKIVGYLAYKKETLISFGLCVEYRQRKYLKEFFSIIKKELHGPFLCSLWSRNIRAVKWLMKNGLRILDTNPHITTLIKN